MENRLFYEKNNLGHRQKWVYIIYNVSSIAWFDGLLILNIWVVLISFALIFGFNMIFGLIPVFRVVKETPAKILARTDIEQILF